jgi:hypothetical protein
VTRLAVIGVGACVAVTVCGVALAHFERPTAFPDPTKGRVPVYRTTGPSIVVCKPDSRDRIARMRADAARRRALDLLASCSEEHIQAAVNRATNGTRILVLPGVYREEPSRAAPFHDLRCAGLEVRASVGTRMIPGYEYTLRCPNAQNLIAIVGDTDLDGVCDAKCDIQLEGVAASPADVLIDGDRTKLNAIRADRADGVYLRNFTVQYSDFNNVYVIETNGFRLDRIVSRWSREYGFLSFTSDHGLYENLTAYGNGDSGVYPGSSPDGDCRRYGIEIRNVNVYGNLTGLAGTAGNSIWVHDSRFHHNGTGVILDSAVPGHPGMPQDCAKLERNRIHSNNVDHFDDARDAYCMRPPLERDPRVVCPSVPAPVGSGVVILGGNRNLLRANWIYDNWRNGVQLHWVPAFQRGEGNIALAYDTSHGNRFLGNHMGVSPKQRRSPNGRDFWWDEEGSRNCWARNGARVRSDPANLPRCPGRPTSQPPKPEKFALLVACAGWHPRENPNPARCPWLRRPPRPR